MYLEARHSRLFHAELQVLMRHGARVCGIQIEVRCEDGEALRIRRLNRQDAAAAQFCGA